MVCPCRTEPWRIWCQVSLWEETESEPSTLDIYEAFEQSASSQLKFLSCLLNSYKVEGF